MGEPVWACPDCGLPRYRTTPCRTCELLSARTEGLPWLEVARA